MKHFLYRGLLVTVFFLSSLMHVSAQAVVTKIDRNDILIGERIQYEVKVNLANSSYKVDFAVPDSIPHLEIMQQEKYDTIDAQGLYSLKLKIVFTSFDSGVWKIPSFPVSISFPNKTPQRFSSDSLLIRVGYSPADSSGQLRDIKPVMEVFVVDRQWIFILAGVILAVILAIVLYRYFKRRKKKPVPVFNTSLTAYDEAMRSLKEMQQTNPVDSSSLKIYYGSLSDILKKYLSRKQNKNLMSETTGDLLLLLRAQINSPELLADTAAALRMADAVKFAKFNAGSAENNNSVQQVMATIQHVEKRTT
jgi:hypothetical protein